MISSALKRDIERFANNLREADPLLQKARTGRVSPRVVAFYLRNIHYLLKHTPVCLQRARDGARAMANEPLASYFEQKLGEEVGHEVWAENDMAELNGRFQVQSNRPRIRFRS